MCWNSMCSYLEMKNASAFFLLKQDDELEGPMVQAMKVIVIHHLADDNPADVTVVTEGNQERLWKPN